jgi:hypothetical protein
MYFSFIYYIYIAAYETIPNLSDLSQSSFHCLIFHEAEVGGSWFKASPGKVSVRPYLKNKLKSERTGPWLKW